MPGDSLQVNINSNGVQQNTFDAIVIGSGISGGWAAKELCEHGLKTLVLERGRNVVHNKDYPTANMNPWEFKHRGKMTEKFVEENPLITKAAGFDESTAHFFIKDKDHPYVQEKPFEWIRGYQVGGKSLIWGRACPRWSKYRFINPARHGYGIEWPISYDDMNLLVFTCIVNFARTHAETKMGSNLCLMENIFRHSNLIVLKKISSKNWNQNIKTGL